MKACCYLGLALCEARTRSASALSTTVPPEGDANGGIEECGLS